MQDVTGTLCGARTFICRSLLWQANQYVIIDCFIWVSAFPIVSNDSAHVRKPDYGGYIVSCRSKIHSDEKLIIFAYR